MLLWLGLGLLVYLQAMYLGSVAGATQHTVLADAAEVIRWNMTPLAWCAYLMALLGLLGYWAGRSWLWRYWNRFWMCWLWSVTAWCYFDWMNFYFMRDPATGLRAWEYHNLPRAFGDRLAGYLVAFGAIAPGMFLTAQVLQELGLHKWNVRVSPERTGVRNRSVPLAVFLLGLLLAPIPLVIGRPVSNLAIWVGTWAVLDPINMYFGRPSIVRDWLEGRWGRTLALGGGGLFCGFLWEFWNFWAYSKWDYHLPFLGSWEHVKYFEMPVPGLVGFIAFGLETWAMWQTMLLLLARFVEGERATEGDQGLSRYGCL